MLRTPNGNPLVVAVLTCVRCARFRPSDFTLAAPRFPPCSAPMLTFNNPAGAWALLAIPALLAIHFLQRKAVVRPISTLFLLDQMQRESLSGQRIERLRPSVPLWLQLLMALLLTWLLVQPRWVQKSLLQRVVVVLDGSISMQAFQARLVAQLPAELQRLASLVNTSEYLVLDSQLEQENIYHGTQLTELAQALTTWTPQGGAHDVTAALRLARSLADQNGLVVLATDHALENLPFGAKVFSVGTPLDNVGFAGLSMEERDGQLLWKATLKNYSDHPQQRRWWVDIPQQPAVKRSVTLAPHAAESLQDIFPPGVNFLTLRTDADAFPVDDALPCVRPEPKQLHVLLPPAEVLTPVETKLYQRLLTSLAQVTLTTDPASANVEVSAYDPFKPVLPTKPALVLTRDPRKELPVLSGEIVAEAHPFVEGLNWQSLVCLDATRIPLRKTDRSLLWQGERSLLFLRGEGANLQLFINFDLRYANAHKLPAFVIMLHRFCEEVRSQLPLRETRNCENGELLHLPNLPADSTTDVTLTRPSPTGELTQHYPAQQASLLQAPATAGAFTVRQGPQELIQGAAHFADTREADFTTAAPRNDLTAAKAAFLTRLAQEDAHWQLAVLGVLAMALLSWWYVARPSEAA